VRLLQKVRILDVGLRDVVKRILLGAFMIKSYVQLVLNLEAYSAEIMDLSSNQTWSEIALRAPPSKVL